MAEQQKAQKVAKNVKKKFYEVSSPLTATKIHLYSTSLEALDNKIVKLDLTRSMRGKNVDLQLRVKLKGNELVSEPAGFFVLGSYIRKIIRRGTDYVEDSFKTETRDSQVLVKIFLMTRHKVSRPVQASLRREAKDFIVSLFKIRTANELFSELLSGKMQRSLSQKLKKIYPLAACEIKEFKVITKTGNVAEVIPKLEISSLPENDTLEEAPEEVKKKK